MSDFQYNRLDQLLGIPSAKGGLLLGTNPETVATVAGQRGATLGTFAGAGLGATVGAGASAYLVSRIYQDYLRKIQKCRGNPVCIKRAQNEYNRKRLLLYGLGTVAGAGLGGVLGRVVSGNWATRYGLSRGQEMSNSEVALLKSFQTGTNILSLIAGLGMLIRAPRLFFGARSIRNIGLIPSLKRNIVTPVQKVYGLFPGVGKFLVGTTAIGFIPEYLRTKYYVSRTNEGESK